MKPWISLTALVLGHVTVLVFSQKSLESKYNETNLMVNDDPCLKSQQVKPDLTQKDTVNFYVHDFYYTRLTLHKQCLDKSGGTEYYSFEQEECVSCEQDSYEAVFCWGYNNDKKIQAVKAELKTVKEELVVFKTQHDKLLNDSVHSLNLLRGEMKVVSEQNLYQKKDFKSVVEDLRFEIVKLHGKIRRTNIFFGSILGVMFIFIAIREFYPRGQSNTCMANIAAFRRAVRRIRGRSESRSGSGASRKEDGGDGAGDGAGEGAGGGAAEGAVEGAGERAGEGAVEESLLAIQTNKFDERSKAFSGSDYSLSSKNSNVYNS